MIAQVRRSSQWTTWWFPVLLWRIFQRQNMLSSTFLPSMHFTCVTRALLFTTTIMGGWFFGALFYTGVGVQKGPDCQEIPYKGFWIGILAIMVKNTLVTKAVVFAGSGIEILVCRMKYVVKKRRGLGLRSCTRLPFPLSCAPTSRTTFVITFIVFFHGQGYNLLASKQAAAAFVPLSSGPHPRVLLASKQASKLPLLLFCCLF